MAENKTRLSSDLEKTNQLLNEKQELLHMNQGLTEDSKSKVTRLEAEKVQLINALKEQEK